MVYHYNNFFITARYSSKALIEGEQGVSWVRLGWTAYLLSS